MNPEIRRHIIELLERGQELPRDYQHVLFPAERQECALVYADKAREADILANTMAVPLKEVRTFGENGSEWHNRLIFGDNLPVMKTLLDQKRAGKLTNADGTQGVRLIYIDPPFATKQEFRADQEQQAYQDNLAGATFLEFLRKRLVVMRELLAENGSLYVHLSWHMAHYVKVLLDEIFGKSRFQNEIAWCYREAINSKKRWNRKHDTILFYSRSDAFLFNYKAVLGEYAESNIKKYKYRDDKGAYRLMGRGIVDSPLRSKRDLPPEFETLYPDLTYRHYLGDGTLPVDYWLIDIENQASHARTGYPTQKPEALLERILLASSNPEDIVLDAFAGSGTTCAVAEKLGRRWIAIDSGKLAFYTIQKRMLNLRAEIGNRGKPLKPKAFTLYHQPNDELAVNDIVEADGFSFIQPPDVQWTVGTAVRKGLLPEAYLHIDAFESRVRRRGADTEGGIETLSMLMLDFDFNGEVFDFDGAFHAHQLEADAWRAWFPLEELGSKIMAVFIDIHGNESQIVIPRDAFGIFAAEAVISMNGRRGSGINRKDPFGMPNFQQAVCPPPDHGVVLPGSLLPGDGYIPPDSEAQ